MSILKRKEVIFLFRLVVGATFVYASIDKVLHPAQFAIAVRSYQILPVSVSNLFAIVLAWSELAAGLMLIAGVCTRKAAGAIFLMLVVFIVALLTAMVKGLVIDCGCFSTDGHMPVNYGLVIRNTLMAIVCVLIIRFDTGALSLQRKFAPASR
jgi:uncharacterized membrane protein YphA (DoxX/SURF4 family)